MNTLGIRHLALNVLDPQKSKSFYTQVLKMKVEWEPDPENVYLTHDGKDNLALHKAKGSSNCKWLDHFGIVVPAAEDVESWYKWIKSLGIPIEKEPITHRDGARSFYFRDPDGILIQLIYHPPIAEFESRRRV